jgi:hypothetical protein
VYIHARYRVPPYTMLIHRRALSTLATWAPCPVSTIRRSARGRTTPSAWRPATAATRMAMTLSEVRFVPQQLSSVGLRADAMSSGDVALLVHCSSLCWVRHFFAVRLGLFQEVPYRCPSASNIADFCGWLADPNSLGARCCSPIPLSRDCAVAVLSSTTFVASTPVVQ